MAVVNTSPDEYDVLWQERILQTPHAGKIASSKKSERSVGAEAARAAAKVLPEEQGRTTALVLSVLALLLAGASIAVGFFTLVPVDVLIPRDQMSVVAAEQSAPNGTTAAVVSENTRHAATPNLTQCDHGDAECDVQATLARVAMLQVALQQEQSRASKLLSQAGSPDKSLSPTKPLATILASGAAIATVTNPKDHEPMSQERSLRSIVTANLQRGQIGRVDSASQGESLIAPGMAAATTTNKGDSMTKEKASSSTLTSLLHEQSHAHHTDETIVSTSDAASRTANGAHLTQRLVSVSTSMTNFPPTTIQAMSRGLCSPGGPLFSVTVDNVKLQVLSTRGICVTVLTPALTLSDSKCFDTWGSSEASFALGHYLDSLPVDGSVVVMGVVDEAADKLGSAATLGTGSNRIKALFHSRDIATLKYRESWLLIGIKGTAPLGEWRGGYVSSTLRKSFPAHCGESEYATTGPYTAATGIVTVHPTEQL
eukprot:m.48817 g.48817  ORF g.48817 m.48817 type:complete len:484 (+) comp11423_c1_seq1:272-1723(+)